MRRTVAAASTTQPDGGTADSASLLEVRDLRVDFRTGRRVVRAVDGLSFDVKRHRTLAVIGESGSGKTVSSRAVMGLLPKSARVSGSIGFAGQELVGRSESQLRRVRGAGMSMVFQDPARSLNPTLRIGAQIGEAVRLHDRSVSRSQALDRAVELMERVRLPAARDRAWQYPHQLSGGMRQRVMIAIALAARPQLLIADEATTALDVTTQAQIIELLRDLQSELGMAVILISHDLGLAAGFADEVVIMYAGRAVERAPVHTLFHDMRMPYTRILLDALPRMDSEPHQRLAAVPGQPPDLASTQVGCPFATRCPRAAPECTAAAPPFTEAEPGHHWACWHPLAAGATSAAPSPRPAAGTEERRG